MHTLQSSSILYIRDMQQYFWYKRRPILETINPGYRRATDRESGTSASLVPNMSSYFRFLVSSFPISYFSFLHPSWPFSVHP